MRILGEIRGENKPSKSSELSPKIRLVCGPLLVELHLPSLYGLGGIRACFEAKFEINTKTTS